MQAPLRCTPGVLYKACILTLIRRSKSPRRLAELRFDWIEVIILMMLLGSDATFLARNGRSMGVYLYVGLGSIVQGTALLLRRLCIQDTTLQSQDKEEGRQVVGTSSKV